MTIILTLLSSVLALGIAQCVSYNTQTADIKYKIGQLNGTLAAVERFETGVESCSVGIARIQGYLDAMELLAGLESGQQWTEVLNEFRQQSTGEESELFEFPWL